MSPKTKAPAHSTQFYEDWAVFCRQALSTMLQERKASISPADVLLAGGAVLGVAGMLALISANRETLDRSSKDWGLAQGFEELSKKKGLGLGGAVLGAAVGGLGVAWLTRALGRHSDTAKVDALQARIGAVRREFEALRQDRQARRLDADKHEQAVERLFAELVHGNDKKR